MAENIKDEVSEKEVAVSTEEDFGRQKTQSLVDAIPDPDPDATPEERAALVSCLLLQRKCETNDCLLTKTLQP